ncbi:hypothetical protein L1887_13588 [Cichorium endivia]|nr:hypothetical protein L1887_13588 [Cichorium endivia]
MTRSLPQKKRKNGDDDLINSHNEFKSLWFKSSFTYELQNYFYETPKGSRSSITEELLKKVNGSLRHKEGQVEQPQYGGGGGGDGGYYGYAQGYEAYGYAPPPQDPNDYYGVYAWAAGYGGYQQPQQFFDLMFVDLTMVGIARDLC